MIRVDDVELDVPGLGDGVARSRVTVRSGLSALPMMRRYVYSRSSRDASSTGSATMVEIAVECMIHLWCVAEDHSGVFPQPRRRGPSASVPRRALTRAQHSVTPSQQRTATLEE